MDPSQILSWLKLPQRVLWALLVVAGLILWGPGWFVHGLGLEKFIDTYRMWLGVVFLLLLATTLPTPIHWVTSTAWEAYKDRRNREAKRARLHDLSKEEKEVLRHYLQNDTRTQSLDCTDGVAAALERAGIIYRPSNLSQGYTDFAYNIRQWALDYLREHPNLLDAA